MSTKRPERRRHTRATRALAIQFRLKRNKSSEGDDTNQWHLSMTTDMSAGGIAFESAVPFAIGDSLELHVVMSGVLDIVKADGRVVRVEEKLPDRLYMVAVELKKRL